MYPHMAETVATTAGQPEFVTDNETVRFHKPSGDVLHDPNIVPQEPGCDEVLLGLPSGECRGVKAANLFIRGLGESGVKVYGNHEPTHGADSTAEVKQLGAEFDLLPEEIPAGSTYVISAHGASPETTKRAVEQGLEVYDVTCPLVSKTHLAVQKAAREGNSTVAYISFGNAEHPEVQGIIGEAEAVDVPLTIVGNQADADELIAKLASLEDKMKVWVVGQTTNNSDEAQELAGYIHGRGAQSGIEVTREDAKDVCHTVRDRQRSVQEMVQKGVNNLVVVGSVKSKNTKSLVEVAKKQALELAHSLDIYLVNSWRQLPRLAGRVGVISGASTLAKNVEGVVTYLNSPKPPVMVGIDSDKDRIFMPTDQRTRQRLGELGIASA